MAHSLLPLSSKNSASKMAFDIIIQTAPYHSSSNGLAERAVQVFKHGIRKQSSGTIHDKILRLLFQYHTTPHGTAGITPATAGY